MLDAEFEAEAKFKEAEQNLIFHIKNIWRKNTAQS